MIYDIIAYNNYCARKTLGLENQTFQDFLDQAMIAYWWGKND